MVVVSGKWVKHVAPRLLPTVDNDMVIPNDSMTAKAVLICRPNSHPFQERTLCLSQPVKVGRSVARARATSTNAIFDCKVLSRHHALLWYDCGKFYLQDTKSSNGTFVNNNRLSSTESEPHEVSSGDIVQFGVDVVENNRKVTHGCIIATLKLYLPDGKEAKASPSITEANRHGLVPLDELYKLNQIIQEATQREQCLETKLIALQNVVEEARKSADESWQAYVGEERLLSRVATLERQLMQASKNWGEDRLREELTKLQEDRNIYQLAAKEALRKVHAEKLDAVSLATEQERARISAEQEGLLAKEQLAQAQQELQEVAQKLIEEQKKADEQKAQLEQRERELQARLDSESQMVSELQTKVEHFNFLSMSLTDLENSKLIFNDDLKAKEEMLAENDHSNGVTEPEQNHINLTVAPVVDDEETDDCESVTSEFEFSCEKAVMNNKSPAETVRQATIVQNDFTDECEEEPEENAKETATVSFKVPESAKDTEDNLHAQNNQECNKDEKDCFDTENVDCKTLKYQFMTAQQELNKQVEKLKQIKHLNESKLGELEKELANEKKSNLERLKECDVLKEELFALQQKCKESCNENQQLRDRIDVLTVELNETQTKIKQLLSERGTLNESPNNKSISNESNENLVSYEQLSAVEEELVLLKERFAQINDEKMLLNKKLLQLHDQYNNLCNRSHNHMFFYIAPLVLMVLYLLISSMFS